MDATTDPAELGNYLPIALFLMGCGMISLLAVWFIEDKTGQNLDSWRFRPG